MSFYELPFGIDRSPLRLDGQDPYLCLHFVIIYVRDLDRSLRFYVDQLGFRVAVPAWGGIHTRFEDPDGNSFGLAGFDELTRHGASSETRSRTPHSSRN